MIRHDIFNLLVALVSIIAGIIITLLSSFNQYRNTTAYIIFLISSVAFAAFSAIFSLYLSNKNKHKDRIFISYNARDRDKAAEITNKIIEFGFNPWIDIKDILPGQNIADEIMSGIEKSSVFIVLLSENYNSNWASKELEMAMCLMRTQDKTFNPILPIIIGDISLSSIPEPLKSIQWLDLRKNEEEGYSKLKEGLKRILGKDD